MNNQLKGKEAEEKAILLLRQKDYQILSRNRRIFGVEIDIIALKKVCPKKKYFTSKNKNMANVYFFFEVKRTKKKFYHEGYQPISYRQIQRYQKAIEQFQLEMDKFASIQIGLILFDEENNLLEFNNNYWLNL